MRLYKVTDADCQTRERTGLRAITKWEIGVKHRSKWGGIIRAHRHPRLAILFHMAQSSFTTPRLWEAEGDPISESTSSADDKAFETVECNELTVLRELEIPWISSEKLVAFAILCAMEVYQEQKFVTWASAWLEGRDRTEGAAEAAYASANAVATGVAKDIDTMSANPAVRIAAASAAVRAAFAARTLKWKDESIDRPDLLGGVKGALAAQGSAESAIWAARYAAMAKSIARKEPIDILRILEKVL
jgi:hypothetical protein